jgi:diguanylate cyclase (GGDEF)-like protein
LETIISSSKTLIKSELSAAVLIDRLSHHITHFISSPLQDIKIKNLAQDIIRELINKKMSIRLNAISGDERFKDIAENVKIRINNLLAVPIMIEGKILGGLIFINKAGGDEFTMEDEDNALMVSFQAAMAIEKSFYHEEVINLARTDGLTGLNNHRTFHEQLDIELKRARRFGNHLSLLLIDIDFFKKFNDTHGHQGGDTALKELAVILRKNLREIDSAGRYGGEEFTIILPETGLDGALKTAERIKKEIGVHPIVINGKETFLTVSIGVSVFPDDAMGKEGLIKAADDALYTAKRLGRNRVVSFHQYKSRRTT